jgi:High potential iron-sulfur protein
MEKSRMNERWQPARRRALRLASIFGALAITRLAGAQQKPPVPKGLKKRSKEAVGYRDFPYENRTCAKCMLYLGDGECAIIDGKVSPEGWCNQWIPPTFG